MPQYIVSVMHSKTGHRYWLEWSTIVDAPTMICEGLAEFVEYYLREYGVRSELELCGRLGRVAGHGSSAVAANQSPRELLAGNRAGPNETELSSWDEIIDHTLQATDNA